MRTAVYGGVLAMVVGCLLSGVGWAKEPIPAAHVQSLQVCLTVLGFEPGPLDGVPGPQTHRAAAAWLQTRFGGQWVKVPGVVLAARMERECREALEAVYQGRMVPTDAW